MSERGVSEAASEKRRGRPRITDAHAEGIIAFVAPEVKTRRGRLEVYYRQLALDVLRDVDGVEWIVSTPEAIAHGTGHGLRFGILAALGRLGDRASIVAVARRLCELRPTTKAAQAMVRRLRLGRAPAADGDRLAERLRRTLNDYVATHPGASWDDIEAAALALLADVRASRDGAGGATA